MRFFILPAAAALTLLIVSPTRAQQPDPAPPASTPAASPAPTPPATMFKLGSDVLRSEFGSWGVTVPLYGGVERQLSQAWSFTADLSPNVSFVARRFGGTQLDRLDAALGTRYYYSRGRRQRKGKTVRAFNGPYLQLQYRSVFNSYYSGDYFGNGWGRSYRHIASPDALWGYQRQLGRRGFFDLGAGVGIRRGVRYFDDALHFPDNTGWGLVLALRGRVGVAF